MPIEPVPAVVPPPTEAAAAPIVFFDGVCGLCNASVDRLLRWDRRGVLRFAPLQGETAAKLLGPLPPDPTTWSMRLAEGDRISDQSDAALRILGILGGWGTLAQVFWLVPRFLRNFVYRAVAVRRYRWFGKQETCRLPKPGERARFLP